MAISGSTIGHCWAEAAADTAVRLHQRSAPFSRGSAFAGIGGHAGLPHRRADAAGEPRTVRGTRCAIAFFVCACRGCLGTGAAHNTMMWPRDRNSIWGLERLLPFRPRLFLLTLFCSPYSSRLEKTKRGRRQLNGAPSAAGISSCHLLRSICAASPHSAASQAVCLRRGAGGWGHCH